MPDATLYWRKRAERAERRNMLNPQATEYVEELEGELALYRQIIKEARSLAESQTAALLAALTPQNEQNYDQAPDS